MPMRMDGSAWRSGSLGGQTAGAGTLSGVEIAMESMAICFVDFPMNKGDFP